MATAETVDLGPPHPPKEDSIVAFTHTLPEIKHELIRLRREYTKHEPEYFAAVEHLEDEDLRKFDVSNLTVVRVATSAYGIHLFGKIRIPALPDSGPAYIHVRLFISEEPAKLHSIHTEEKEEADGDKKYRAIFTENDELEWFDT
ncbi:unnamed protein product [Clonostachys rosea f. rosea IK726]|uniref:Uncharacterized protein n=2 Tax=Bionectria ochroleuca TaxID=29856 RepID=A0A0B7JSA0_BIOOC|nr:unnamed protein product [Clonostachys rosea f. rosea IK726]